jgi:pimeloyl-ACP methyl ester carboxylesterase/DNA-binding CsgD family transcriptional regulator
MGRRIVEKNAGRGRENKIVGADLEMIASSYRSMIDAEAFDAMMEAWAMRLGFESNSAPTIALSDDTKAQMKQVELLVREVALDPAEDPMSAAISEFASAAMVMSPQHRVMALNGQGGAAFAAERGRLNSLTWLQPDSVADFMAISASAKARGNAQHAIVKVRDESDNQPAKLAEVYVLNVHGHDYDYLVVRMLDIPWSDSIGPVLMTSFGFTEAEADVCRLLYQLRDGELVAKARKASVLTVRTQLKSILAKAQIENRVELIRLLAMLCARQARRGRVAEWSDPLGRERILIRPCGRRLAYTWFGADGGTPVLLVHGPSIGPYFSDQLDSQMAKAGIRLLAPSRPGYGNSDPDTEAAPIDEQTTAIDWFCQKLGLNNVPAIGLGCGVASLLSISASNHNRFSRILQFGYFLPLNSERLARQPKVQQTFFQLARRAPWILETVIKIGYRTMLKKGIDWYLDRAYKEAPLDLASCRNPEKAPLIRNGCAHMMHQGPQAFSRDLALVWEPVETWMGRLNAPFHWVVGRHHDGFSEAEAEDWSTRFKDCTLTVVPDAGELIIYQKPEYVVEKIVRFAAGNI